MLLNIRSTTAYQEIETNPIKWKIPIRKSKKLNLKMNLEIWNGNWTMISQVEWKGNEN